MYKFKLLVSEKLSSKRKCRWFSIDFRQSIWVVTENSCLSANSDETVWEYTEKIVLSEYIYKFPRNFCISHYILVILSETLWRLELSETFVGIHAMYSCSEVITDKCNLFCNLSRPDRYMLSVLYTYKINKTYQIAKIKIINYELYIFDV